MMTRHIVIRPVARKEGREKVTGRAVYVDDYALPGMLHGVTIRTPSARGRIRGISFAPHIPWDEFVVVTAKDIPGHNAVALITWQNQSRQGRVAICPPKTNSRLVARAKLPSG